MSHEATAWACRQSVPPIAKLFLLHISDGHTIGDGNVCWNTQYMAIAAEFCGTSITELNKQLRILERHKLIPWDKDTGDVDLCIPVDDRHHYITLKSLPPVPVSPQLKNRVLIRDRLRCRYCGQEVEPNAAHIDHVIPRSKGGLNTYNNLVTSCQTCNLHKGPKTPEEAGMHLSLLSYTYVGETHEYRAD